MITDMASYLRFFDSVRRRTERDVAALPSAAAGWRPPAIGGETGWSIGQIVLHIGGSRLYFASAYRGEGWLWAKAEADPDDQRTWLFVQNVMDGLGQCPFVAELTDRTILGPPSL